MCVKIPTSFKHNTLRIIGLQPKKRKLYREAVLCSLLCVYISSLI
jgi:hypothetical protein